MNAKRAAVVAALAAGFLIAACGRDDASPRTPVAVRATPPPTAYIGRIAAAGVEAALQDALEVSDAMVHIASVPVAETPAATPPTPTALAAAPASQRTPPPTPRVAGARARIVDRVPTTEKRVALTFDAGADRGYAEQILDTLRDAGVHASFGMTGQWAEANPDLLRRMVAEGHHIINHTQTHDSFTGLSTGRAPKSPEARARELAMTEAAVLRIAGVSTKPYFRPPYGDLDASVREDVQTQGYEIIAMWTVDSQGWNGLSRTGIEARCLRMAAPGAVYVFHVGSAAQDGPALPAIIAGLRQQGYQVGTLEWLLRS
ncbi:MAG: polysaccharide deacetylase family protein [Dehalococcoidia bacterium]|nr:MAG: polysaccharide deacetylase family protein [Dehalococcoidia bacterium]